MPVSSGPGAYVARRLDGLAARYHTGWLLLLLVRGVWLGLMVSAVWTALAAVTGLTPPGVGTVIALGVIGSVLGIVLGLTVRPDRRRLARMLDRTFGLDERMTTAVELLAAPSQPAGRSRLDAVQLADAGNQLAVLRLPGRLTTFFPVRELLLLLLWTMLLLALVFAGLNALSIPSPSRAAIPAYVPASQRLAAPEEAPPVSGPMPSVAEVQERSRRSNEARRDLDHLGEALAEQPTTLTAAEAIAAGEYPQAAESLRTAAAESSQLSPEARAALADDLDAAAGEMSEGSPDLAGATRDAADGLRTGDAEAEAGLGGLADEVERTGEEVVPQRELVDQQAAAAQGSNAEQQPGGATAGEEGAAGSEQQPGETGSETGQGQDPGAGADARSGTTSDQQEGGQEAEGGQQAGSAGGENQAGGEGGTGSNEGAEGAQGAQGQEGATGASGASGEAQQAGAESGAEASSGQPNAGDPAGESRQSGQGSGAGSGQSSPNDPSGDQPESSGEQRQPGQPADEPAGVGRAGDPPPDTVGGSDARPTAVAGSGDQTVSLSGESDEGVQTGGSAGSASLGSGSGAGAGGGDVVQGAVGPAGPDSNRVPADYRDVVSSYFDAEQQP